MEHNVPTDLVDYRPNPVQGLSNISLPYRSSGRSYDGHDRLLDGTMLYPGCYPTLPIHERLGWLFSCCSGYRTLRSSSSSQQGTTMNFFALLALASQIGAEIAKLAFGQPVTIKTYVGKQHISITLQAIP